MIILLYNSGVAAYRCAKQSRLCGRPRKARKKGWVRTHQEGSACTHAHATLCHGARSEPFSLFLFSTFPSLHLFIYASLVFGKFKNTAMCSVICLICFCSCPSAVFPVCLPVLPNMFVVLCCFHFVARVGGMWRRPLNLGSKWFIQWRCSGHNAL